MEITFNIPLGIDIEFNEACNASCVFCPVNINPRRKNKHMSLEDSDIIFKKLEKQTIDFISFSVFNEPLLDPLFFQRIEQLRKYKLYKKLALHTNGILLTQKVLDFLQEKDLKRIVFNFPSAIETEWSVQMGGMHKKHFLPTLDNILSFCKLHKNVPVTIEMNRKLFLEQPEEYRNNLSQLFGPSVYINIGPLINQAGNINNEHVESPPINRIFNHTFCRDGKLLNSITINYDGDCRLCCKDYQKKYTVGNILTDSIKDILTSKESKRLISQIYGSNSKDKDLLCKNCTNFLTI